MTGPQILNDTEVVWKITNGIADLYVVEQHPNQPLGVNRTYIGEFAVNALLFAHNAADSLQFLAIPRPGCNMEPLDMNDIVNQGLDFDNLIAIEHWITQLSRPLYNIYPFDNNIILEADPNNNHNLHDIISTPANSVIWVRVNAGVYHFNGLDNFYILPDKSLVPLCEFSCIKAMRNQNQCDGIFSTMIMENGELYKNLPIFHGIIMGLWREYLHIQRARYAHETTNQVKEIQRQSHHINHEFSQIFQTGKNVKKELINQSVPPYLKICRILATELHIVINEDEIRQYIDKSMDFLDILRNIGVKMRTISLVNNQWHQYDSGYILTSFKDNMQPVILIPEMGKQYKIIDPIRGEIKPLKNKDLNNLAPLGWMLYPPLPKKIHSMLDVIKITSFGQKQNIAKIAFFAIFVGVLSLLTPILTGKILSIYMPAGLYNEFIFALAVLGLAVMGKVFFQLNNAITIIRISNRMGLYIGASVIDKALKLPHQFFQPHPTGDWVHRLHGLDKIRQKLSVFVISAIIALLTGLTNIAVMGYYAPELLGLCLFIMFVYIVICVVLFALQINPHRQTLNLQGQLFGLVFAICRNISKLRSMNLEKLAENKIMHGFIAFKRKQISAIYWQMWNDIVSGMVGNLFYVIVVVYIISLLISQWHLAMKPQEFIAFNIAFGQASAALILAMQTINSIIDIIPMYQRCEPIINEQLPAPKQTLNIHKYANDLSCQQLSFGYENGHKILHNINLTIPAGSNCAIIGGNASGKTTLIKLLLGILTPESGAIYWQNYDYETLNMDYMRQHIGVVMGHSALFYGSIRENILAGNHETSDNDIIKLYDNLGFGQFMRSLPLGLDTMVTDNDIGLSYNQRIMILLARALIRNPKIFIIDNAIINLDKNLRHQIFQYLNQLHITRIITANNCQQVGHVDMVFQLQGGVICKQGKLSEFI